MNKNNQTVKSINPATGESLGDFELHTAADIHEVVSRARVAQLKWAALTIEQRIEILQSVHKVMLEEADNIVLTISRDNGKTRNDALATEVIPATIALKYYCKNAKKILREKRLKSGTWLMFNKRSKINKIPYGVVGIISPWNYPFSIPFSEVIMALLAGNTVVLKVATETLAVGEKLAEIFKKSNLPQDVFNYINAPGKVVGPAMLSAGVDKIFFTGSVPVGKILMAEAAKTLTPVVLELGGNDAMIVCEDANLDRAAAGAVWGGISNAGQSCAGIERIYVHEKVYDEFLKKLGIIVKSLHCGIGEDLLTDLNVMAKKSQKELVQSHINDAVEKGATIYARSPEPEEKLENFMPATILTGVTHEMEVMKEETFGPVLAVAKVKDIEEAIHFANNSQYGLTGSVWSKNQKEAAIIAAKLSAGVITLNDHIISHGLPETPWGGFRESGIGRTHGEIGFDEMIQPQVVVKDLIHFTKGNFWWHPYGPELYRGLKAILDAMFGENFSQRIKGFWTLLKTFRRVL